MRRNELRENRSPGAILLNMLIAAVSLFVNGFGIYLTIQANIGAAPWDVLNLGLSKSLGILYGNASIAISVTILVIDILLKEPIGIAMFIDAVVVGKAVDFYAESLAAWQMQGSLVQLRCPEDVFPRNGTDGIETQGREHIPGGHLSAVVVAA